MSTKKLILRVAAIALLGLAFFMLIAAMITHAVCKDSFFGSAIIAMISVALAFGGVITACFSAKGE